MNRNRFAPVLVAVGLLFVTVGVALIFVPAAFVVAGVALVALGLFGIEVE